AIFLAISVSLTGLVSGCGSGGGTAAVVSNAVIGPASDTKANATPLVTGASRGCTVATFSPNYANIIPLYRWSGMPVRVRFINSGVITKNDGTQADLQQVALEGFEEWVA